ncbi:GFA family protein [Bradyrhizobium sp.]|uniref:GFA family protein n=1 Tax=Bradyrhizobium sp. TaxID=376 RepID=UPI001D272114|nr:GFA family protein [Bradyrhizobium sp.]MBI5321314.1 GFA family protein [Bradyrhizobium sp.]
MSWNHGGCLCGALRYATAAKPLRVTFCHCKFCQRATGSAYMVEPIFERTNFAMTAGTPAIYALASKGSGKRVSINFCATCGTRLFLAFERFPDILGVYGGTFDDPDWFERTPLTSRHIFLDSARQGTIIPAGVRAYREHTMLNDGTPVEPVIFEQPHEIGKRSTGSAWR